MAWAGAATRAALAAAAVLLASFAWANICIVAPVTVAKVRGRVFYVIERGGEKSPAEGVEVRLLKPGSGQPEIVARASTDAEGRFTLPDASPGVYELSFSSSAAASALRVTIKQGSRNKWLAVNLGLVQAQGCPPTEVAAQHAEQ